jgi:hypothetical protein
VEASTANHLFAAFQHIAFSPLDFVSLSFGFLVIGISQQSVASERDSVLPVAPFLMSTRRDETKASEGAWMFTHENGGFRRNDVRATTQLYMNHG